jgi:hypothetical protein
MMKKLVLCFQRGKNHPAQQQTRHHVFQQILYLHTLCGNIPHQCYYCNYLSRDIRDTYCYQAPRSHVKFRQFLCWSRDIRDAYCYKQLL